MAGFTDSALEKKLSELNSSQQSIQTLSLWLIHHRKHHKSIVQIWFHELRKAKANRKLIFMYLANDVIQNSKKKGPEFSKEFVTILSKAFTHVAHAVSDDKTKNGLERIIKVWEERNIYEKSTIETLRQAIHEKKPKKNTDSDSFDKLAEKPKDKSTEKRTKSSVEKTSTDSEHSTKKKRSILKEEIDLKLTPPGLTDPPDPDTLIKALLDLENSPSTDAEVREKIASLPPEVSDINLLEKIQNRESAEQLAKQVEDACLLLADYNSRLSEELEQRKTVSKMLSEFLYHQKERVCTSEQKAEEFRDRLKRVSQVKTELKSHLQNLPDIKRLPTVTGGLAPLPAPGDLFN